MKHKMIWITLVAVMALSLIGTTVVSADSGSPTPQPRQCGILDNLFNRDGCGKSARFANDEDGILHEYMLKVFSDKLGIPAADIESRLDAGESMSQIAIAEGFTLEEFQAWMLDARSQAIDLAVADGTLTQEQADWMNSRGGMMFGGTGRSQGRGMMGGRQGRFGGMMFGNSQPTDNDDYPDCPNLP
jgi:hypothetical protein